MKISKRVFGKKEHTVLIIDHIFKNPDVVRHAALKQSYSNDMSAYPGVTATPDWDYSGLTAVIRELAGDGADIQDLEIRLSMVTKQGSELEPWQCIPHFDELDLSGVIYLNLPDQCRGGTAFYRHKASGLEAMPSKIDVGLMLLMMRHNFQTSQDLFNWVMSPPEHSTGYITESTADWELLDLIEMKYNRLIIYNGRLFHSGYIQDDDFGQTMAGCRLTLNVFIRNQEKEQA